MCGDLTLDFGVHVMVLNQKRYAARRNFMNRRQKRFSFALIFLIFSCLFTDGVLPDDISVEQFVSRVNEAREHIKSGELRMIVTEELNERNSTAIENWVRTQFNERRKGLPTGDSGKELKQMIKVEAKRFEAHQQVHEINIAFEVDAIRSYHNPENYRYKQWIIEKTDWAEKDPRGVFMNIQTMSLYNGGIQLVAAEIPDQLRLYLFQSDKVKPTFSNYHVWGRSRYRVSEENVKALKIERVNGIKYLVGTVDMGEAYITTLWLDAKNGWIVKEENHAKAGEAVLLFEYKDFFTSPGGIWYPTIISAKVLNNPSRRVNSTTHQIKEAIFNVEFPPDFFLIDLEKIYKSGVQVSPTSEIKMERSVEEKRVTDVQCAPNSLLYICKTFDIDATLDELSSLCKVDATSGTSLLNLYRAAKEKGLEPEAVRLDINQLKKSNFPAIVHLNYDHFFVVDGIKDNRVIIYDKPDSYDLSTEEFQEIWDGIVLLVKDPRKLRETRAKPDESQPPKIHFAHTSYNFGTALGGEKVTHTFDFTNEGNETLVIYRVETSCRCTAADLEEKEFLNGQAGTIEVTLDLPTRKRSQMLETVSVYTNDPVEPKVDLQLTGKVFIPIIPQPNYILLGRKRLLKPHEARLVLHLSEKEHTQITLVEASASYITVKSEDSKVTLIIGKDAPIGSLKEFLTVHYTYKDRKYFLTVPISGEILSPVVLSSHRVFLGIVENQQATKQITVSGEGDSLIDVISVETDSPGLSTSVLRRAPSRYDVQVLLDTDLLPQGEYYGSITIKTTSEKQAEIEIPVYAIIKKG